MGRNVCRVAVLAVLWLLGPSRAACGAGEPIGPGDRIFMQADQWVRNGTADQLEGFTVLRLSSYMTRAQMRAVTRPPIRKKLMIGLALDLSPTPGVWPDEVLRAYRRDGGGPLGAFADSLRAWTGAGVEISAVFFNLEYRYSGFSFFRRLVHSPEDVARRYARVVRAYKAVLRKTVSDSVQLWVYGSSPYLQKGCDWNALTETRTDSNAIDVCQISEWINVDPDYGTLAAREAALGIPLKEVKAHANGKPVVFQAHTYGSGYPQIRNRYPLRWDDYEALVRYAKTVADSLNGFDSPVAYWQGHYTAVVNGHGTPYTLDGAPAPPPASAIPWPDRGPSYPARLWRPGQPRNWNATVNPWEAEFLFHFLRAVGSLN